VKIPRKKEIIHYRHVELHDKILRHSMKLRQMKMLEIKNCNPPKPNKFLTWQFHAMYYNQQGFPYGGHSIEILWFLKEFEVL